MYKEKQYVVAGYQERRYNYYSEQWGVWYECSEHQYRHDLKHPEPDTQVREIYALEN
jgi:hypothetical protein